MVLTDAQKAQLLASVVDYLESVGLKESAAVLEKEAGVDAAAKGAAKGLLEKKWSSVLRLQKKLMQLEEENKQLKENSSSLGGPGGGKRPAHQALPLAPALHTLKGHRGGVGCVRFHPQYPLLATCSEDASIKVWDSETGQFERTLKGHTNGVNGLAFSAQGLLLASCSSDLTCKLWSVETWECLKTMHGHDHVVSAVAFAQQDALLLSCSRDHSLRVWDTATGYCVRQLRGHSEWVRSVSIAPAAVVQGAGVVASAGHDRAVRVWDLQKGTSLQEMHGHEHVVECVQWAPPQSNPWIEDLENAKDLAEKQTECRYVATGGRDKTIRVWDASTGQCVMTLKGHENWVRALEFHPGGKMLVSVGDDYAIRVWDLSARRLVKTIENAHDHFIGTLHYSKLGFIATGDVDSEVKIWQMK